MKFLQLSLMLFLLSPTTSSGQDNYSWDVIVDSITGDKEQLYSRTKMFIAESWKSANHVIQNDDREAGVILVKGVTPVTVVQNYGFVAVTHSFDHIAKFYLKDGRCRLILTTSKSSKVSADPPASVVSWKEITDIAEPFRGVMHSGLSRKGYEEVQVSLKSKLQELVDLYMSYMKSAKELEDDW